SYLILSVRARFRRRHDIGQFRQNLGQWLAKRFTFGAARQFFGGAIENTYGTASIYTDDPGTCAGQNRFRKPPPAINEIARKHDVVTLCSQFSRHASERFAKLIEIALRLADRHSYIKVSGGYCICGTNQPADRRNKPVGEIQADPYGRK